MFKHIYRCLLSLPLAIVCGTACADGPQDNLPDQVRPIPPVGLELSAGDDSYLRQGLMLLEDAIASLKKKKDPRTRQLLPDVEIFVRAVRSGFEHRELFSPQDVESAKRLLSTGLERAGALAQGMAPWTTQTGLVVRGFRSRIDQTVQPYGLVIPESYTFAGKDRFRLDLWFHGRGERLSETAFIQERMTQQGRIAPRDTIVLHPYGRYSNAFKFAGEVDVLEAWEHARQNYRIDDNRVAVRGFSMGGAGCWQLAVHYPDLFFAANPGAGFSETPEFLKSFQQETLTPTWYEQKLWQWYDCPGYARNLFQLPTIAYSGELDVQKQAADVMEQAMARVDLRLTHIIGPETKHSIHADSLRTIEEKLERLAEQGRERLPREIRFATYTLKYNRCYWVTVTALDEHWKQATVTGKILGGNTVSLAVENVRGLRLTIPAGRSPLALDKNVEIVVASRPEDLASPFANLPKLKAARPGSDGSFEAELYFDGKQWQLGSPPASGLVKRHNLQGPIDDAFMDSFIVVRSTGKARHAAVERWANAELERFVREWRRQFRGDAIVKADIEITDEDIANNHLILFGDFQSNAVLRSIADELPIPWSPERIVVGEKTYDAAHHAPVMIYPNPANPQRYVVLNSGFTYREYAYLNNARQVPKLPDWAIVDLSVAPDTLWPGRIVDAGFFDESWQIK